MTRLLQQCVFKYSKMVLECGGNVLSEVDPKVESSSLASKAGAARDYAAKKKKVNRRAKLKQCKLDARREQWLSQGKNKITWQQQQQQQHNENGGSSKDSCATNSASTNSGEGNNSSTQTEQVETLRRSFSDIDSRSSKASIEEEEYENEGCSSEDINSKSQAPDSSQEEDEEEDDGSSDVEDDWEAAADALNIGQPLPKPVKEEIQSISDNASDDSKSKFSIEDGILKPEYKIKSTSAGNKSLRSVSGRAWRPDDASRPNTLPKLTKLHSFPSQSCRPLCWGSTWNGNHHNASTSSVPVPLSCPICYEDLDVTDFNFVPCNCGFRLCLFCHKRILEQDGRCPGCRKRYSVNDTSAKVAIVRLPRSCSMRLKV